MTGRALGLMLLAVFVVLVSAVTLRQCEGNPPEIAAPERLMVGKAAKTIAIEVSDEGRGLRSLAVRLVHPEGEQALFERDFPAMALGGPKRSGPLDIAIDAGVIGLREGSAKLVIEARDRSWRSALSGNQRVVEIPIEIDLTPPRISLERGIEYVQRGGAGALRYSVRGADAGDGIRVGESWFAGNPRGPDGESGGRIAVFAVPVDPKGGTRVHVVARDLAGNEVSLEAPVSVRDRKFPETPIQLPKRFLEEKVPELAAHLGIVKSDAVEAFRTINETTRAENEAKILEITQTSSETPLFDQSFSQLANSQVTSRFAERRTYLIDGEKPISKATHYGYDLASFRQAPIGAANSGRVLFADDLGIYGTCVILDHGLGITSLYGHLSSIEVAVGDEVERGQVLGYSGTTGLAGGDHLHFAVAVRGVYVDPIEWWDPKWVREHLTSKFVTAKSESEAPGTP